MKKTTTITLIATGAILSLVGGVYFSTIDKEYLGSTFTDTVQSQAVNKEESQLSPEEIIRIQTRIDAIRTEIKKEQNDPERAILLRTELLSLEKQLNK